jgi:hypothetical protein
MIFRSQLRRQAVTNCMLMFIPNIIIAAVIAWFMEGGVLGFGIALMGLLALGIAYWIIGSIVTWIAWLLVGRRTAEQRFLDYLVENNYPRPRTYEASPADYFAYVMDNIDLEQQLRIKAAVEVGTLAAYSGALDFQRLAKVSAAAESALAAYARRTMSPRKQSGEDLRADF